MRLSSWILSLFCPIGAAFVVSFKVVGVDRTRFGKPIQDPIFNLSAAQRGQHNSQQPIQLHTEHASPSVAGSSRDRIRSVVSGVLATMIMAELSVPAMSQALSPSVTATVQEPIELSRGAFVIQTTSGNLLKSTIDSKSLVKTLISNRKELSTSVGRIQSVISSELQNPAWKNVLKELVEVEGDLASSVQVSLPSDIKATLQDLASGKFNLIFNGEIFNIAVDPSFGKDEDEIKVTIKGFKQGQVARTLPKLSEPIYGPIRTYFSKYEGFWSWWGTPYPSQYMLPGMAATNGEILLTGTAGTIWLIYISAYAYYQYEREQELLASQEKKTKLEAAAVAKSQKPVTTKRNKNVIPPSSTEVLLEQGSPQQLEQRAEVVKIEDSTARKEGGFEQVSPQHQQGVVGRIEEATPVTRRKRRFGGIFFWRKRKDE